MNAHDFAPIHPQALAWIDRTMPQNRAGRPSEDVELSRQANEAIQRLHQNVARVLNADSDLSAHVVSDAPDEPTVIETAQPAIAAEETAPREDDNPFQGKGRGGVRPDPEVIEVLLASYSVQRKAVWRWCVDNQAIITHDMPSARVAGKGAGVSYETARHVLSDFRFHYRLTPPAMTA